MRRRNVLAALGATLAAASGGLRIRDARSGANDIAAGSERESAPLARRGTPSNICESDVIDDFGIRAIVDPAVAPDWSGVDVDPEYRSAGEGLAADAVVIGVERGGRSRAYPLAVVWHHEIVNDDLVGPLLVSYCPICNSGAVTERRVGGEPTTFRVSGQLWRPPRIHAAGSAAANRTFAATTESTADEAEIRNSGNLVMVDDATGSYWSQILGRAICGPREGERLAMVRSRVARWSDWRRAHPDTDVLLPPPHSELE